MLKVGVVRQSGTSCVEAGSRVLVKWTVVNPGDIPWDHCHLRLHEQEGVQAPEELSVPALGPGQTVEVGTEVVVAEGSVRVSYLLEVWGGEEGQVVVADWSAAAEQPRLPLDGQVVYADNVSDDTGAVREAGGPMQELLEAMGITQVVSADVEQSGVFECLLRNNGKEAWPQGTSLRLCTGPAMNGVTCIDFHAVAPDEMVHVAMTMDHAETSRWALCTPEGKVFGPLIQACGSGAVSECSEWVALEAEEVETALGAVMALSLLQQHGFQDDQTNLQLLQLYNGDVCKVIEILEGRA